MFKMITFNKADMKGSYMDTIGCPIYSAMKRAGIPVTIVGGDSWYTGDINRQEHDFSKKLNAASIVLADSCAVDSEKSMKMKKKLIGKSFKIAYLFLFLMVMTAGCGVEGVYLDKAYRICRGHNGIQSVNIDTREVACHDGLVKNFRTRARG